MLSILGATLTEESLAEIIGCTTSRAAWLALESTFTQFSISTFKGKSAM